MDKPLEWKQQYQVVVCTSAIEFQWTLDEAMQKGYTLHSWRDLYHADVGYGIMAVFTRDK